MKVKQLFIGDVKFQFKYGFYLIYCVFACLYIILIKTLPESWTQTLGILLIYTDPSIMGLIFMGSIVHLEIEEKTFNSLCIAPIKPIEYLIGKLLSFALLSVFVALAIGISVQVIDHYLSFIIAIFFGSMIFSSIGLMLAFKTYSLNQFILSIIPFMILIIIPGGAYLFGHGSAYYLLHPGVATVELLMNGHHLFIAFISLLLWFCLLVFIAHKVVKQRFKDERRDQG